MKVNLLNLLCLTSVVSASFPYYDTIHLGLSALYAYFEPNSPIAVKIAFWGSFVEALDCTLDKAIDVCIACEAKHEEPKWDCTRASKDLGISVVKNAISLYVGWQHAGTPNGSLEGQDTTALKKRSIARHCMSDEGYDHSCVSSWLSDHYRDGMVTGWHEVSYPFVKRDNELPNIYVKNNETGISYHLIFNPASETNGAIAMSVVGNSNSSIGLMKRSNNYPIYAPLCDSYIALDYCANQSKWAGIYQSGELTNMLEELLQNDVNGGWKSDFYKMYTIQENGKDQDWEISWRMYLAHAGNWIHWTQCDTGY
ncbi:hypothetical protein C6P44_003013 [Monosporozyma unispora]|nr:hypothetical protein C6P44_003013 [Kazachstania unispora]